MACEIASAGGVTRKMEMASETEGKGEVTVMIKSQPDVLWSAIRTSTIMFPVAIPDLYTSITPNPKNSEERQVTYGPSSPNIKSSTEVITENTEEVFIYRVTGGDIPSKYHVHDFKAIISYPIMQRMSWTWTYRYSPDHQTSASKLNADMADIAKQTLEKLDNFLRIKST
ncbi:hypothetical protein P3X46_021001 [Hevea brasiliensis]|uniref:Bet v I/Major latex protein domain-containing protein n=1 Tax=Hevea brasiliensis TaxID=3981 RepID=A0ABQ9LG20_HEVBR|nr:uncharacterized protein LOC110664359 [Hevea brasiliensis]KAJ9166220.1 hypothetical protein P3X46_021001 [Hevea brasiliensis]